MIDEASLHRPDAATAAAYRAAGWWRDATFLDDLAGWARTRPTHPAIVAYQDGAARTVTYAELAGLVDRFAGALAALGIGRGDVVVSYLPNLWLLAPLYLACNRIGAISSPLTPVLAERELRHVLTVSAAAACVTTDSYGGVDHGARLAAVAPPTLRHRIVVGDAAATGAVDFTDHVVGTDHAPPDPAAALGPDEPAMVLYTSGTSGTMKAVAHCHNTVFAAVRSVAEPYGLGADDVITVPNYHTHMAGMTYALFMSLRLGATCVVQDANTDMDLLLDLVERHGVSWAYLSPGYLVDMIAAQRKTPRDTSSLHRIVSGSAPIHPQLIADVRDTFDVPLHSLWGMTENGGVTVTRPDDPDDWAAHSDGRNEEWMRVRIDAGDDPDAGRLLVRGASQCLGYLGQRDLYAGCLDDEGWFDTGDLARDDGRGGIRIVGRNGDLITRASGKKIPVLEVEAVLARHPRITELALVGYPDPAVPGAELCCAVVVPDGQPPMLEDLHEYVAAAGMAEVFWPDRVQFVWRLPKNSVGKVLRRPLRERLELAAARP